MAWNGIRGLGERFMWVLMEGDVGRGKVNFFKGRFHVLLEGVFLNVF
ncbi:hypothetical protein [Bartonella sp. MM73XJBT.G]|nr:hypothetical protein [Bartonella sp. MM73XJBT.G]